MSAWENHLLTRGDPAIRGITWGPGVDCNFYLSEVEPPYHKCTAAMGIVVTNLVTARVALTLNDQPGRGGYEIPGGHIDELPDGTRETPVVAAAREIGEETTVDAGVLRLAERLKIFAYYEITNPPNSRYPPRTYMTFHAALAPDAPKHMRPPTDPEVPGAEIRTLYAIEKVLLAHGRITATEYAIALHGVRAVRRWHEPSTA